MKSNEKLVNNQLGIIENYTKINEHQRKKYVESMKEQMKINGQLMRSMKIRYKFNVNVMNHRCDSAQNQSQRTNCLAGCPSCLPCLAELAWSSCTSS